MRDIYCSTFLHLENNNVTFLLTGLIVICCHYYRGQSFHTTFYYNVALFLGYSIIILLYKCTIQIKYLKVTLTKVYGTGVLMYLCINVQFIYIVIMYLPLIQMILLLQLFPLCTILIKYSVTRCPFYSNTLESCFKKIIFQDLPGESVSVSIKAACNSFWHLMSPESL